MKCIKICYFFRFVINILFEWMGNFIILNVIDINGNRKKFSKLKKGEVGKSKIFV